jgi:hypothetical protein
MTLMGSALLAKRKQALSAVDALLNTTQGLLRLDLRLCRTFVNDRIVLEACSCGGAGGATSKSSLAKAPR